MVADTWRATHAAALSFQRMELHLTKISMIDAFVRPIPIGIRWQDSGASNQPPPRIHFFAVVAMRD
jgi:hypothetical protein